MKTRIISMAALLFVMGIARSASSADGTERLLQEKSFGNIPYNSGGVGSEERDRLNALSHDDNLRLSFALAKGEYLGGADVKIEDNKGQEILEAEADGPLFFAKLPAGKYTVQATTMGRTLTRTVNISARRQTPIYFVWKDDDRHQGVN